MAFSFGSIIETELRSLNSVTSNGHSRRSSDTSEYSTMSESMSQQLASYATNGQIEDVYQVWSQIITDWPNFYKKQKPFVQVRLLGGWSQ